MSNYKVSKEVIQVFTHPNADSLQLGKVGAYQVVVQKGLYNDGDEVVFAPEKSVLTGEIKDMFETYLVGPNKDRVKAVRLRNEISSGIIIPKSAVPNFDSYEIGEDISEDLGIKKYDPPIPAQLAGKVASFDIPFIGSHDCEHIGVYVNQFEQGERIVVTEKLHGSQAIFAINLEDDSVLVSSKGLLKSGLLIQESDENAYWRAIRNDKLVEKVKDNFTSGVVQIFGEVVPIQTGYSYGKKDPTILIFTIRHNGVSIPHDKVPDVFKSAWAPIVYDGPLTLIEKEVVIYEDVDKGIRKTKIEYFLPQEIVDLCKGMELVSGNELHIREGVVISPYIDRNATDGIKMKFKIINPKYRETGEEIN